MVADIRGSLEELSRQDLEELPWNLTNSGFWINWESCLDTSLSLLYIAIFKDNVN